MNRVDLVIKNGIILTMDNDERVIEPGFIAINDNKIVAVGAGNSSQYSAKETIDANGAIILPGLINTHTHIPMTYFRGLADDLALDDWLQKYIWPAEAKYLDSNFVYQAALHGCAELVRNGITYFNDMYFWSDRIAEATKKVGIKATLGEGILNQPIGNFSSPQEIIDFVLELNNKFKDDADIDFAIAPHAIYTCSEEVLKLCAKVAKNNNLPVHIHLSETKSEVDNCKKQHNLLPLEYLQKCELIDNHTIIAHGTFLSAKELQNVEKSKIHIAVNTTCNLKLASGITPLKMFEDYGINYSISTDGVASNNNLDLFEETKITSLLQKNSNADPAFLKAKNLVKAITIDAARALNKSDKIGSLEKGKVADLIILNTNRVENQPIHNPYSAIVYNLNGSNVDSVISNGKIIMRNRQLLTVDEAEIIEQANKFRKRWEEK